MTQPFLSPEDDLQEQRLVAFLKQHSPSPPPATPDLEERILAAIRQPVQPSQTTRPILIGLSTALAAGLAIAWGTSQWLGSPATLTAQEQAELESFLEGTWSSLVPEPEEELFPLDLGG